MSAAVAVTEPQPQPQSLGMPPGLDRVTLTIMARNVIAGLPVAANASPREIAILQEGAVTAVLDYRPRNPREATLAACIVNADRASADCFHRATLPDVPDAMVLRYLGKAASLARLSMSAAGALQSLQRQPAPPMLRAGSAASLIAEMSGRPAAQAAPGAANVGQDPMHRGVPDSASAAGASAGQDPMSGGGSAPALAADTNAGKDPMHREAAAPHPGATARPKQHLMSSGASMLALAAAANAGKDPMHRGAGAPLPAGIVQYPMPSGAPAARPGSAIERTPTAEEHRSARLADELMGMGREAAQARGA